MKNERGAVAHEPRRKGVLLGVATCHALSDVGAGANVAADVWGLPWGSRPKARR